MIQKLFNLCIALIFLVLVVLFAYKETVKPVVSNVKLSNVEQNKTDEDNKSSAVTAGQKQLSKQEVNQAIKDFIIDNPEIIVESLENLHNKKINESTQKTINYLNTNKDLIENKDSPPFLGNPAGNITVVAFYDYNCAFCKKANDFENELIASDPQVKIVLRPLPILDESSTYAAKVALAVHKIAPESFLNFHNDLMKMKHVTEDSVKSLAAKYIIDYEIVENEINSYAVKRLISKNFDFAKEIGIKGTPSYVINGKFFAGLMTLDKFKSIVMQIRSESVPDAGSDAGSPPEACGQAPAQPE